MKGGRFVITIKGPQETGHAWAGTIWAVSGAWELPAGPLVEKGCEEF